MPIHNITNRLIVQTLDQIKRDRKAELRRKKASAPPRVNSNKKVVSLNDGNSLYLELSTVNIGRGTWRLRFMHNKTRYVQAIGDFYYEYQGSAGLSLEDARRIAPVVREALINQNKAELNANLGATVRKTIYTFDYVLELYKLSKELRKNTLMSFDRNSRKLKKLGLSEYSIEDITLSTLEKHIKQEDLDTTVISAITNLNTLRNYGAKLDLFPPVAPLDIKLIYKVPEVKHHKQLSLSELEEVINWLNLNKISFNKMYLFTIVLIILTLCRRNEIYRLEEDDLKIKDSSDDCFLHIPKEKMKNKQEHILPVHKLTFELLTYYVKLKKPEKSYFSKLMTQYKKETNFLKEFSYHSFRSTGASILNDLAPKHIDPKDVGDFSNIISMCLSHAHKQSKVDAIYNRYNYFKEKQVIMNYWSELLFKNTNILNIINYLIKQSKDKS